MVLSKTLPKQCVWLTLNNMRSFKNIDFLPPLPCWAGDAALPLHLGMPARVGLGAADGSSTPATADPGAHLPAHTPAPLLGTCELRVRAVRGRSGFCVKRCWRCREVPVKLQSISDTLFGPIPPPRLRVVATILLTFLSVSHGGADQSAYAELWSDSLRLSK